MISHLAAEIESTTLRRGVLGMLAVLWLNMAMLPCAMAFQAADDCPHCPPADEHAHHGSMAAHEDRHEQAAKPACGTAQTDCCEEIAANVDGRGSKFEYRPSSDVAIAGAALADTLSSRRCAHCCRAADPPEISACSPPLRTLYCVYLK